MILLFIKINKKEIFITIPKRKKKLQIDRSNESKKSHFFHLNKLQWKKKEKKKSSQ